MCVCYVGTSPFVTTPLRGIVPQLCEQLADGSNILLVKTMCEQVSTQTAAVLLAALLGVSSYPLLTAQLCWLLHFIPLPFGVNQKSGSTLLLAAAFAALGILSELDISQDYEADTWLSVGIRMVLLTSMIISGVEFASLTRCNYLLSAKSHHGRALHFYVAQRVREVQELQASKEWVAHFRFSPFHEALWRYRSTPAVWYLLVCLQAAALLVWAYLIRPHCDVAVGAGVGINLIYWLFRLCRGSWKRLRRRDPMEAWWNSLPDAGPDEDEFCDNEAESPITDDPETLEEELEEEQHRHEIEKMRLALDGDGASRWSWIRLLCWLSLLCACSIELLRRLDSLQNF